MAEQIENFFDELFEDEEVVSPEIIAKTIERLKERCEISGISVEKISDESEEDLYKFGFKCGRNRRYVSMWRPEYLVEMESICFEKYSFLADYEAICSYEDGYIEAGIRAAGSASSMQAIQRSLFGNPFLKMFDSKSRGIVVKSNDDSALTIEVSSTSKEFKILSQLNGKSELSVKISGASFKQHDLALEFLKKVTGSLFFQMDLLMKIPFILRRESQRGNLLRSKKKINMTLKDDLQFPSTEFDEAPLSLYWYGRSAQEMPLLQFLAYYQVIEFYFPVYSQAEAQRKIKGILKNPTFRGDRDADVARLLSAIQVTRSGSYGDERSQLRATILECVDAESVREFIASEDDVKALYAAGNKTLSAHKIPISNHGLDLRGDIADRIYDIRCKIVHTKTDARDGNSELLLPFSKEAELLSCDIKLVQYVAQQVLIAGSRKHFF